MESVKQRIDELRKELDQHNYNYYVLSTPTISDFDFDRMMKELYNFIRTMVVAY